MPTGAHAGSHSGRLGAEQRLAHGHGDGAAVSFHFPLSSDQARCSETINVTNTMKDGVDQLIAVVWMN